MSDNDTLSLERDPQWIEKNGDAHTAPASETAAGPGASPLGSAAQSLDLASGDGGPGESEARQGRKISQKWMKTAAGLGARKGSAQAAKAAEAAKAAQDGGGAWLWLPHGVGPKPQWRKRHPILFRGGCLLLLFFVFALGYQSAGNNFGAGPKIAVVNVDGMIVDSGAIVDWMEKVRNDRSFKGAIIRINSPGGGVGPSQELYAAVKRLAQAKPVVASLGALAASGGYYTALGADEIIAGPSTLTASIGVIMQIPNFEGLLRTLGISEKTIATGRLKGAGSGWREITPEEEAYFRSLLADMYEEFIGTVAKERDLSPDKVREIADGRAMTGRQALEAGLVDKLGDIHLAVTVVSEKAGLGADEAGLVQGPEKPSSWLADLMSSAMQMALEKKAALEQPVFIY
ncbi:MAG: signal peptide peptidase SppA [Desulfovibrio sp.]|jgi:protease-4|nr:signal peptide peptidase SppA [Desulfovibrio sp.]